MFEFRDCQLKINCYICMAIDINLMVTTIPKPTIYIQKKKKKRGRNTKVIENNIIKQGKRLKEERNRKDLQKQLENNLKMAIIRAQ